MKTLVYGGAGYVGTAVVAELLREGHEVTVFDAMNFGAESLLGHLHNPKFRLVKGDVRDAAAVGAALAGHDAAVLLAAIVGEPACNRDPKLAEATNLQGAQHVLDAAKKHKVARLVFASTCSNYGVADTSTPIDEAGTLNPISVYSETKVEAERRLLAAKDEVCTTVLRLSTAFGVSGRMRFDLMVSDFTLSAVRDHKVVIYGQQFWRPFVHINDIATAIRLVLHAPEDKVRGEVFNVGGDSNNITKLDLGNMIVEEVAGSNVEFVEQNKDPRSSRVSFAKVKRVLGFEPAWSLRDGVREVRDALLAGVWKDPIDGRYRN